MRIAHLSDPHLLDLEGVPMARLLFNKRLTGMVNLVLHRGHLHHLAVIEAMMDDLRDQHVDHVVVTGDITNLALEPELALAQRVFARLGTDGQRLSVVPGNHDLYTRGSQRSHRFVEAFREHVRCDLGLASEGDHPSGLFPYVQLRGPVAFIGLSTAVARLPLIASGHLGQRQLELLARALRHPELARRTPVVLIHHPLVNPRGWVGRMARGLREAQAVRAILATRPGALVLHGHLHDRVHRALRQPGGGTLHHLGATSATLVHRHHHRMASYNLYDLGPGGELVSVHARIWNPVTGRFEDGTVRQCPDEGPPAGA